MKLCRLKSVARDLEITTGIGCSVACAYCPQKVISRAYKGVRTLSYPDFCVCVDKLPSNVTVTFAGMAEPWLNKDCTKMILYASKSHSVSVFTTLTGATEIDIASVSGISFKHFCIHLPDDKLSENIPQTAQYLAVISACINAIKGVSFSLHGNLRHDLKSLGLSATGSSKSLISRAGNCAFTSGVTRKKGKISCSSCGTDLRHNVLLPNGDIVLCCMDYGLKHVLGNLIKTDYESIYSANAYQSLIAGLTAEDSAAICRQCELSVLLP